MWTVSGRPHPAADLGTLGPERVLYDFDGPRIFTCRDKSGQLLLAFLCDEDETVARFLIVPSNERIIEELEAGRWPVRRALDQMPWAWLADVPHGAGVRTAWQVEVAALPPDVLPRPGTLLLPTMRARLGETLAPERRAVFQRAQRHVQRKGLAAA